MPSQFVAMPSSIGKPKPRSFASEYNMPENFLEVEVCNPRTHGTRSMYTDYEIKLKSNIPIFKAESSVRRRYSDFEVFREMLKSDLPRVNVPQLPGKVFTNRFSPEVIKKRMEGLDKFVQHIASHPLVQNGAPKLLSSFLQDATWNKEDWLY